MKVQSYKGSFYLFVYEDGVNKITFKPIPLDTEDVYKTSVSEYLNFINRLNDTKNRILALKNLVAILESVYDKN